ncbi:hypothetical protein CPLU01_13993 [Colletotrichum plurivorum]|uniref:Uncharacterized protein n=1 Tax=Colletotrichum plurivorum TaxID=2175906 RepID=A0A8H6JMF2_9PEZI|nr:hypothetical protein CPLU01_13993 [Colletotrichum plurivorum]
MLTIPTTVKKFHISFITRTTTAALAKAKADLTSPPAPSPPPTAQKRKAPRSPSPQRPTTNDQLSVSLHPFSTWPKLMEEMLHQEMADNEVIIFDKMVEQQGR